MDGITDSMHINLSKLWEIVKDGEDWRAAVHGVTELDTAEPPNNSINSITCLPLRSTGRREIIRKSTQKLRQASVHTAS